MTSVEWGLESPGADVCIVGAGPVGLALAFKLETLGLSVVLIEMGGGGSEDRASGSDIEFKNSHHASSPAMSRPGIGGASALWGGRCVAFDDIDFEKRSHVPYSGWPVPHEVIRSHYREALVFLRANADEPDLVPLASDTTIRTDALERWSSEPDVGPRSRRRLHNSGRIRVMNARAKAILLDPAGKRVTGLILEDGARELHVEAGTFVLAGGGLENARLLLSLQRQHPQLWGGEQGPLGRFYQGHLTGYLAVLQFENAAVARHFLFQRDRRDCIFRRRLQVAPEMQIDQGLLNCVFWLDPISIADPIHGSGALSLLYLLLKTLGLYRWLSHGLAPTARGYGNITVRRHWSNVRADGQSLRGLGAAIRNLVQRRFSRWRILVNPRGRYLLRYHAEQVPNPESRVTLQPQARLALAVDYRVTEQDLASVLRSHDILDAWLQRNRLGRLEYLHDAASRRGAVLKQAFDGYHQIGLSRMAKTEAEGVADADCRVHGVSNLYLAGSGLFPTGGHANPTLPAVALALRLAEHLKATVAASSEVKSS